MFWNTTLSQGRAARIVAVASLILGVFASLASADGPTVDPRVVIARGNGYPAPDRLEPVWEVDLAAAQDWAIAVFHQGFEIPKRVAYSVGWYDAQEQAWQWDPNNYEQQVPAPEGGGHTWDPSVAADPDSGDFIAVAMGSGERYAVLFSTLDPNYPDPRFKPWDVLADRSAEGQEADKPWIITGQQTTYGREFYVVWCVDKPGAGDPPGFAYARTVDGGQHWTAEPNMPIRVNGERVLGGWCAQHATVPGNPAAPIYVAYRAAGNSFRFLKGVDVDTDLPANPRVSFVQLTTGIMPGNRANGRPGLFPLELSLHAGKLDDYVPSPVRCLYVPYVLADPTDPGRLFIVYHDTVVENPVPPDPNDPNDPNDIDVDVFIRVITHVVGSNWLLGDPVRVNQDTKDPDHPADQFIPAATIDALGRVHVSFYDDRNYPTQHDEMSDVGPVFDAGTGGWSWEEVKLDAAPGGEPALDTALWYDGTREYHGIVHYDTGGRDEVLTAYTGTDPNEPGNFKAVIYSNRITDLP